jgi:hypothetical protein
VPAATIFRKRRRRCFGDDGDDVPEASGATIATFRQRRDPGDDGDNISETARSRKRRRK